MRWNDHLDLEGKHAFLSASKYSWLNYDKGKLIDVYKNHLAVKRGTLEHAFACDAIKLKHKLEINNKTINRYINDCISEKMRPEQVLYFSEKCFGTADAIKFDGMNLKIFDLKTGKTKPSFKQLYVYCALFCLEYNLDPKKMTFETRLYWQDTILFEEPDPIYILEIMDKIVTADKILDRYWED